MRTALQRNPDGSPRSLLVVASNGAVHTVAKDHPNWRRILAALELQDESSLVQAISMTGTIETFGDDVRGRGDITFDGTARVLYRGVQLFGEDIDRMLAYKAGGFPEESMVLFLEAKLRNISPRSVESLYKFLDNKGMPLTDNGTVLGYKGVRSDYFSINTGQEPLIEGTRDDRGGIRNAIGDVVAMDRRYVCADFDNPCGPGLHIGSRNYATNWAGNGRVMVVEFSPEFVVSVPTVEAEKLRVSRYRVVGELNGAFLGNVYNNEYVRPATEPTPPPAPVEIESPVVPEVVEKAKKLVVIGKPAPRTDFGRGQSDGYKDGKAHQKRKFYEVDRGAKFDDYSPEYVSGYLLGYRNGRG